MFQTATSQHLSSVGVFVLVFLLRLTVSTCCWRSSTRPQGQHLLCDLQGGGYDTHYILTDPAVLSLKQDFGATDGGTRMMKSLGQPFEQLFVAELSRLG